MSNQNRLNVSSIFDSVSGEAGFFSQGSWTTFVRLQGCNLNPRCRYCDTPHAQVIGYGDGGQMEIGDIVHRCISTRQVLITGGEPLLQRNTGELIEALRAAGNVVQVETNGSLPIPSRLSAWWVVDRKGPSSGISPNRLSSQNWGSGTMIAKYVVSHQSLGAMQEDLEFAAEDMWYLLEQGYTQDSPLGPQFIVSPMDADPKVVENAVTFFHNHHATLLERLIFSIQIHKIINCP